MFVCKSWKLEVKLWTLTIIITYYVDNIVELGTFKNVGCWSLKLKVLMLKIYVMSLTISHWYNDGKEIYVKSEEIGATQSLGMLAWETVVPPHMAKRKERREPLALKS